MKKMNNSLGKITFMFFTVGLALIILLGCSNNMTSNTATTTTTNVTEEYVLEFSAISDIHIKSYESIERERFKAALELSYQNTSNLDAVVINGDFTDGGHDPQYDAFVDIFNTNTTDDTVKIVNLGNHENGRNESDSHEHFRETFGYGIDHVWEVNGFTFITLGVHHVDRYLDSQAKWLSSKLKIAEAKDPEKPIFVLTHYPTYQTTANSFKNGRSTFKDVLEQYPQVVNISGHSHSPLNDPRMIHQDKFTSFNNGSFTYLFVEKSDFNGPEDLASVGHFAIFKVTKDNKVIIERHLIDDNDINNSIKLDEDYVIDISLGVEGFKYQRGWYDDYTKPYFEENANISLDRGNNSWVLKFDQAKDNRLVYYYTVSIKDVEAGTTLKVMKINSQFYEVEVPTEIIKEFSLDLEIGKRYEVSIIAHNVANRSSEVISQEFIINQ